MQRILILCLLVCFQGVSMQHAQAQQNIILLIADDVSPEYFGFYSTTTDTATTPNIRSLAAKGITFSKVWASPVCSPTRAGIFTGRHSFRTGVGALLALPHLPKDVYWMQAQQGTQTRTAKLIWAGE